MSTNPTTPGIADFLPAGPIDEEKLVRATYQTINKQYDPDKSIAEIFHSIQCSIDDPRADGRIDEAGREVVLYACTVTLRRNKVFEFIMEAEDKLAHEREERRQLFKDIHRCEEEGKVTDAYLEAVTQGFGRSRRTNRLAKIIELAGDASQVLDISNIDIMLYDFDDTFGNVPDALIETMLQPHGMETLRRRMEFADKVVARLHEDFPGMMAELPSNLLQAEGPEGQPGPGARAGRYRGIDLKPKKPV